MGQARFPFREPFSKYNSFRRRAPQPLVAMPASHANAGLAGGLQVVTMGMRTEGAVTLCPRCGLTHHGGGDGVPGIPPRATIFEASGSHIFHKG